VQPITPNDPLDQSPNPDVIQAIGWQAAYTAHSDAPITTRVVRAQVPLLHGPTRVGRRLAAWSGAAMDDALPLRLPGGLHNLHLTGREPRLAPVYRGELADQAEVDALIGAVVADHDAALLPWLDGPPQTNEAGRSAAIMAALLWLARDGDTRFELNELGASAGINSMLDRFAFDLGGTRAGPADSPLRIAPEWRGNPPPAVPVTIAGIRGCDRAPLDLTDPAQALRLKSYVWADATDRMARLDARDRPGAGAAAARRSRRRGGLGGGPADRAARGRYHAGAVPHDRLAIPARCDARGDHRGDRGRRCPGQRIAPPGLGAAGNQPCRAAQRTGRAGLAGGWRAGAAGHGTSARPLGRMVRIRCLSGRGGARCVRANRRGTIPIPTPRPATARRRKCR
jgi:hypothetical protein